MKSAKKAHFYNVVVVGGGFGGVRTALKLAGDKRCSVTVVSDRESFLYYPLLYATATGAARKISSIPLTKIFAGKRVKLVTDMVVGIDTSRKLVVGTTGQYQYDSVVFALGSVTNYFGIEGLKQHSWSIKSPEGIQAFRRHIHNELITTKHYDKHYVIIGAGPTGVELAASLKDYLLRVGARHELRQHNINVTLIEAASRVLPRMSEASSSAAAKRLKELGVHVEVNTSVKRLDNETLQAGNRSISTETVVWTSGVKNNPFYAAHDAVFHMNERGLVLVNEHLEAAPDIFVIGDNAATKYAGLAQTAVRDGAYVAKIIQRKLSGLELTPYIPKRPYSIVPVGHFWAVLERGGIHLHGVSAAVIRKAADFIGYHDILPFGAALGLWLSERETEEFGCELCQKNNNSSRVAPTP